MIFKIKLSIFDSDDELTSDEIKELDEMILERRNREYLLKQLKEMVLFKKRMSKLEYPNVPNPNYINVTNGELTACNSLNYDRVVVFNINGTPVSNEEDVEFCKVAYQLLMHDNEEVDDIDLEITSEGNNLVIKNTKQRYLRRKYGK